MALIMPGIKLGREKIYTGAMIKQLAELPDAVQSVVMPHHNN